MKTTAFIRKQGTIQPIRIDDFPGVAIESFFKVTIQFMPFMDV